MQQLPATRTPMLLPIRKFHKIALVEFVSLGCKVLLAMLAGDECFAHVLFAFALYGSDPKYTHGMIQNCEMINVSFPGSKVGIALGNDVPEDIVKELEAHHAVLTRLDFAGAAAMAERMFLWEENPAFAGCEVMFVRDADSRVHSRDQRCIHAFLKSEHLAHTIRDHIYHQQLIMGGLMGLKRAALVDLVGGKLRPRYRAFLEVGNGGGPCSSEYGTDERFLSSVLYPLVQEALLVHSDLWEEGKECTERKECKEWNESPHFPKSPTFEGLPPLTSEFEFCGNVELYNEGQFSPQFSYCEPPLIALIASSGGRDSLLGSLVTRTFVHEVHLLRRMLMSFPSAQRYSILWDMLTAVYKLDLCADLPLSFFKLWETTHVDEQIILYSNHFINKITKGQGPIGVSGPIGDRVLSEILPPLTIVYCNIPMDYRNLPCSPIIYRHPVHVFSLSHTSFISHPCWEPFGSIHVINLEERTDRFLEIMVELSRVQAPLDRVVHYRARKDGDRLSAYRGATKNHIDVLDKIVQEAARAEAAAVHHLILEDDVTFTALISQMHADLEEAHVRIGTDYDLLFLAASKFHEIEEIGDDFPGLKDLVRVSKQECTTSSAYMINVVNAKRVLKVAREGYDGMMVGQVLDPQKVHENCIDRYWSRLNPHNRMLIFKRKMAYQRPTFSNLTGKINVVHFD